MLHSNLASKFLTFLLFYFTLAVMPDRVTSYGTDDGEAVMWLRFVSTEQNKFDEGELFCAQLVQNTPCADAQVCQGFNPDLDKHVNGTAAMFHASVSWKSMGKAKASEITAAMKDFNNTGKPIQFKDMFDVPKATAKMSAEDLAKDPYYGTINANGFNETDPTQATTADPKGKGYPCANGFTGISAGGRGTECLKIRKKFVGSEKKEGETIAKLASRLETRRYAAMLGCTTEMNKWEGSAYDPIGRVMYTSISKFEKMTDPKQPSGDGRPQDVIRVPKKNSCGCVLEVGMADETFKASYVKSHLCGSSSKIEAACNITSKDDLKALADAVAKDSGYGKSIKMKVCDDYLFNQCNKSEISEPDGLAFMTEFNQLVIMEDTGAGHRNDYVWVQNGWDGKKTRIFTTPIGSEATGAMWFPNLGPGVDGGPFSYLGIVVQHPYDEADGGYTDKEIGKIESSGKGLIAPDAAAKRGYVGVLGPLKRVDKYSAASSLSASMIVSFVSVLSVSLVAV